MSGGHWGYEEFKVLEVLERVGQDVAVKTRFPSLAIELQAVGALLHQIIHTLDYDLSGDASITDDAAFEKAALAQLGSPLRGRKP